ncbi:hypothetical protein HYFRA_00009603 [Hymenoscyphus fraxineus]|uniref:Uncharacterized protein n=1 Tax=Hymenoscyphus fraxineus TaxID=746836 RepID=A0A9N9KXF5_9HELO|nr:hypothetical protein HYFRA_00009603 [Hymenoscyphus fraxineus]
MSAATSIPRRLTYQLPENGYESPMVLGSEENFFDQTNGTVNDAGLGDQRQRRPPYAGNNRLYTRDEECQTQDRSDGTSTVVSAQGDEEEGQRKFGFRDRIGCYTWTWFTMTMATGGIANVLHSIPYKSNWLQIIGAIIFLFNITLFLMNCFFITLRFRWNPGSFESSFKSPSESLFIPAFVTIRTISVSRSSLTPNRVGTILINMAQYGIPRTGEWFQTVMQVCFWSYALATFLASSGMYLIIWSTQTFPIHTMTPIWIFPAYPALMIAPLASNIIASLPNATAAARINSIAIAYGAVCIQGTGFMVSLMIYSAFIYRLMTQKLPRESTRPGMFVSVGPSGFTAVGIVKLGSALEKIMPNGWLGHPDAAFFLRLLSIMVGLWIWGLCLWFFLVSVGAHWQLVLLKKEKHQIHFDMTWYSYVFPNTALISATLAIGKALGSKAIQIFGTVLSALLVGLWIIVFCMMIRALVFKRLLWPGRVDGSEISWKQWIGVWERFVGSTEKNAQGSG